MMKALHFGAGKIGRGFIGAVLEKSGYELTFADVNQEVIDLINKEGYYTVHIVDRNPHNEDVRNIKAVNSGSEEVIRMIAEADLITTAVSLRILPFIAPAIAQGLRKRREDGNISPLNIICCENGIRATSSLKGFVMENTDGETAAWIEENIGFADCSVDRIVPLSDLENPLDVAVEEFYEWNVEEAAIKGERPSVAGLNFTDNLEACIEKKLFTLNTGHCTTAFLGMMKGYTYIHEAISDPKIQTIVRNVMTQSGAALVKKFGIDPEAHAKYVDKVISRFGNPHLNDLVSRVGHDPVRKLGPNLYFTYPMNMALEFGVPFDHIATAVAAVLHCDNPEDPQSVEIRQAVKETGPAAAFIKFCGITDPVAVSTVAESYDRLESLLF